MNDSNSDLSSESSEYALPAFTLPGAEEIVKQERKTNRKFWLLLPVGLLLGYVFGQLMSSINGPPDPDRIRLGGWQKLALITVLPVSAFLVILAHEMGHVAGGRLAGLRFLFVIAGPLKVTRTERGLSWQVNRSLALMGGLACCVPRDPKQFLNAMKPMIAGGPLASFLLAGLCYVLSSSVDVLPFSASWLLLVSRLLQGTALMSLFIGIMTLYPGTSGSLKTDGRQLIELFKSNPHAQRQNLVRLLVGQSLAGIRPSEWDSGTVGKLDEAYAELADDEKTLQERVTWASLRSAVAEDQGDVETAHQLIQFNLTHSNLYPVFARGTLFLAAAIFEARVRHDADAAEALIQAAPEGILVESYLVTTAKAEVCRLRGDIEQAKTLAQDALNETASALDAGGVIMEREHLLAIINGPDASDLEQS